MLTLTKESSNFYRLDIGPKLTVFFSYRTPIAFINNGDLPVVSRNEWGKATGKHLNNVDGGTRKAKLNRVPYKVFQSLLARALSNIDLKFDLLDLVESSS